MHRPTDGLTRREFLVATVAAAGLAACSDGGSDPGGAAPVSSTSSSSTTAAPDSPVTSDPFTLGVASGDPLHDRVVLWTLLRPAEPLPSDDVAVEWEVGLDEDLGELVASGTATAVAALGHSVHVDATGLEPDTEYHYRFRVGGFESRPARTRTFAAPGTTPERFTFAFSSCQSFEDGFYAAHRDIADSDDLDAFLFLGDYIYENASSGDPARPRLTGQDFECVTLDQYRQRYAVYRADPMLQAAHARVPWIVAWDDHEVDNDYAGAVSERDAPPEEFLARRAAAYQAWYEHMPVRLEPPTGPDLAVHRSFAHGDLLRFHVLDTRQHRSDQQQGEPFIDQFGDAVQVRIDEPGRTMLGEAQRQWLLDGAASSSAVWDVVAQQVLMFGGNAIAGADPPVVIVDTWDGYAEERQVVLEGLHGSVDNLVVLTGDFHAAAVGELRADPFDPDLPVVGTELMASSISSSFFDDDAVVVGLVSAALSANPHIRWFDADRGYTRCEVTPERLVATYRAVEDPLDEASAVTTKSAWEVLAGTPGVRQRS